MAFPISVSWQSIFGLRSQFWTAEKVGFLNFNFTRHEILDFSLFLVYLTRVQRRKKIRERIV